MPFYSQKMLQYRYFSKQLDDYDWSEKDILDFGGNIGNILLDPGSTITTNRYWCIDVDPGAIEKGREIHPDAHWYHYDRQNSFFNPTGQPDLKLPELNQKFDYILAYSVFTNTLRSDMIELVKQLQDLLKPGGRLAFSFIDAHHRSWPDTYNGNNLLWRLERDNENNPDVDIESLMQQAAGAQWCTLVNAKRLYVNTDEISDQDGTQQSCYSFFTVDHLRSIYPDAAFHLPVNGEMQHCCVISQ